MMCSSRYAISYVRTGVPVKAFPGVLKDVEVTTEIQELSHGTFCLGPSPASQPYKHRLEEPHSFLRKLSQESLRVWLSQAHRKSSL